MEKITPAHIYRGLLFAASLFIVGIFWDIPFLVALLLLGIFLEVNRTLDWRYVKTGIICMILGSIAEIIAIAYKTWEYTEPQFVGIPIWLPILWGIAATFFLAMALFVGDIPRSKRRKLK